MNIKEIQAKNILSRSQVYDYALNPYVGCQHDCVYCYSRFMKRFTGHREKWGEVVDVKINTPELAEFVQCCLKDVAAIFLQQHQKPQQDYFIIDRKLSIYDYYFPPWIFNDDRFSDGVNLHLTFIYRKEQT